MTDTRIPLENLPEWAQDMIIRTALGLLEHPDAYATCSDNPLWFHIHSGGFVYTCYKHASYVY